VRMRSRHDVEVSPSKKEVLGAVPSLGEVGSRTRLSFLPIALQGGW
jgi:hypothetical protein